MNIVNYIVKIRARPAEAGRAIRAARQPAAIPRAKITVMNTIPQYSLVIFPNPEQLELVSSYKKKLRSKIGWFGSANSAGHITVINIEDETTFERYIQPIRDFCKVAAPQNVVLNSWDSFGEHTFFIAPDQPSKLYLDQIIIELHRHLGLTISEAYAHLSIARSLNAEKMKEAYRLFGNKEIDLAFHCDALYVRSFNQQTKQYSDIIEKIAFEG